MKMNLNISAKPTRINWHIFFRKVHKWIGLILGLQFVLWAVSGAVMALLDKEKVGGHAAPPAAAVSTAWESDIAAPALDRPVSALTLRRLLDRPVYEVSDGAGTRLLDARTGAPITVDGALATEVARTAFHHQAPVRAVTRLEKTNLEARDHQAPLWRVDFADEENSSSYVSAVTARPLVNRGDTWRTWDFFWMLHNMDYVNRSSFNHPLIIFVAFGTLWLSFTGFYLLFKSFRRREFRWVLGRGRAK